MAVDRKQQILEAAYEIVGEEGLEGLHARSVALKVGVNHAAVHYYYPKRPDLLLAVTNYAVARFASDRSALLSNAKTASDRVDAHLAQAEAYAQPNSRFVKNWASFFVAGLMDEAIRSELIRNLREWAVTLNVDVKESARAGEAAPDSPFADSELLAATLLGLMLTAQTIGPDFKISEKLDIVAGSLLL